MHKSILIAVLLAGACGGDDTADSSGVAQTKQIKDLSGDERMQECEWGVAFQGGAGKSTACGDGVTVTVNSVSDCVQDMATYATNGCTATILQLEACTKAVAADPCSFGGATCQPIIDCLQ
jgi:hypothetical protein